MSWSWTLYRYLALQFLQGVLVVYAGFLILAYSIDMVNLLNTTSGHNVSIAIVTGMAVLQLPELGQHLLPFAILLGSIFTFLRLSRTQELVAARAAGISVWEILLAPLGVAVTLAVLAVMVFTPISARMFAEFAGLEARYVKGVQLSVSENGLWLRQGNEQSQSVIHANSVTNQGQHLENVQVLLFAADDRFIGRINAQSADLDEDVWRLKKAFVSTPGSAPVLHPDYQISTTLTPDQIQASFQSPDTLSFWNLPEFIRSAEAAGFSAVRYKIYLYTLYALPLLFAAMVLMAASVSLRPSREGGTAKVVLLGAASGFGVYFFANLTQLLGVSRTIPVLLAATAPAIVSILIGMTLLFHKEDG